MFRRFGGPKRASKTEQKKLVQNAKELKKDPMKVVPVCEGNCFLCKFGRAKRKIKKIEKIKDDEEELKKYAKRGPGLSKALAGTLLLAHEGKAPRLATARTPRGSLSYAKKSSARANRVIGIQHFDDPNLRLIAYTKEAKRGYYLYSVGDKVVCTGKEDDPPEEFIKESISNSPYDYKKKGDTFYCRSAARGKDRSYFELNWKSIGKKFIIDSRCANKNSNLFMNLVSGMISKDNTEPFSIEGEYMMDCRGDCDSCRFGKKIQIDQELKDKYFSGKVSDDGFIQRFEKNSFDKVKKREDIFAIGDRCYGKDKKRFLADLRYEEWEKPAVIAAIKGSQGLVLENGTVNEFFSRLWENKGIEAIYAVIGDKKKAKKIYNEYDLDEYRPREILKKARETKQREERLSSLPEFKDLPPKGRLADAVAKTYKVEGKEKAIQKLQDFEIDDTRMRSVAFGFMKAFDEGDSSRWKYSESEVKSGEFMEEYINKLLEATGEEYAEALQNLLKMSGSTEEIEIK